MTFQEQLNALAAEAKRTLAACRNAEELFAAEKKYLGRNGSVTLLVKQVKEVPLPERPAAGRVANDVRRMLQALLEERRRSQGGSEVQADLTLPASRQAVGSRHPLIAMQERIEDIFRTMGYELLFGPEIELAKYNFDLLNIPDHHPARDVWDTFYVGGEKPKTPGDTPLLRTHISPMQVRVMEERKPPIRFISPGRVFRHEATDASHEANYLYCEGMAIEQGLTFADLLGTLEEFFHALFGANVEIRAQPSFFPFVEPGAEILMKGHKGWMEMLGCGMIHPTVLRNMRVDPKKYAGFAFGIGIDRLMMYYEGVPDIRLSYQGDLRFLSQF